MSSVLVAAPHMDDEVMGCGGAIARHVGMGDQVTVCVIANRAYLHQYRPEDIHAEMIDCASAQKVLGYSTLKFFGHPDERVGLNLVGVLFDLEEAVRETAPEIVYMPWRGDYHQDHRSVFDAMMIACRPHAPHRVSMLVAYESMSASDFFGPFIPNLYVDIRAHLDKKLEALQCYRREGRSWPHPRSPKGVAGKARQRGSEVGLDAAEAFMVLRRVI